MLKGFSPPDYFLHLSSGKTLSTNDDFGIQNVDASWILGKGRGTRGLGLDPYGAALSQMTF